VHNDLFLSASLIGEAMQSMVNTVSRHTGKEQPLSNVKHRHFLVPGTGALRVHMIYNLNRFYVFERACELPEASCSRQNRTRSREFTKSVVSCIKRNAGRNC